MTGVAVVKRPRLRKFRKSNVDLGRVILAVRDVAAAYPDRIYKAPNGASCLYKPSRQPDGTLSGCIVGEALRRTGVSTNGCEDQGIGTLCEKRLQRNLHNDDRQVMWLQFVQSRQDRGQTWSQAVIEADRQVPLA